MILRVVPAITQQSSSHKLYCQSRCHGLGRIKYKTLLLNSFLIYVSRGSRTALEDLLQESNTFFFFVSVMLTAMRVLQVQDIQIFLCYDRVNINNNNQLNLSSTFFFTHLKIKYYKFCKWYTFIFSLHNIIVSIHV